MQVVGTLANNLGWPSIIANLSTRILIVGFPIILILAWLYELTPQGLKLTKKLPQDAHDNSISSRRLNRVIIGTLAITLCFVLVERFFFAENTSINQKQKASIAVLPFDFQSNEKSLAFMSEALSGAISDRLGQVSGLMVTAKTSNSQFRDSGADAREIGKNLDVNYLIEGDLLFENNRVRLSARLVNASNGYVRWRRQYDQELSSIMKLEEDIAKQVVDELRIEVFPNEALQLSKSISKNSEAYQLYLEALELKKVRKEKNLSGAIKLIEEALVYEPLFAKAHAELVILYMLKNNYGELNQNIMVEKMEYHLRQAQDIDASLPEVHLASSMVEESINRDTSEAIAQTRKAIQINNNYAAAHYALHNRLIRLEGADSAATRAMKKAYTLDPFNGFYAGRLAAMYHRQGNIQEALEILNKIIAKNPYAPGTGTKSMILAQAPYGDLAKAFINNHQTLDKNNYQVEKLGALMRNCLELDLVPVANYYAKLIQWNFPNNEISYHSLQWLNLYLGNYRENIVLTNIWHGKGNISERRAKIDLTQNYTALKDYKKAQNILKSLHPKLATTIDTLTLKTELPFKEKFWAIQHFMEVWKGQKKSDKIKLVRKKMSQIDLNKGAFYNKYYFLGKPDSLTYHLRKIWFEKKNRSIALVGGIRGGYFNEFENHTEFKKFVSDVLNETHRMRAEVITYLKEKGDWNPDWDKEFGLE